MTHTPISRAASRLILTGLALVAITSGPVAAADTTAVADEAGRDLGTVSFPNSCACSAQADLTRGLALLHHMTYLEAAASFDKAATADPQCAVAYWGQAMALVHPLWPDVVSQQNLVTGRQLLLRGDSSEHKNARESSYLEALGRYFVGEDTPEVERLEALRQGWEKASESYPEDPEAALFHSLALMATAGSAEDPIAVKRRAGAIADAVQQRIPNHPGAHHYTIHAYDVPQLAEKALETARRYGQVAPENSHALHMTSHIFTRLGLWPESITFNRRAAAAAGERNAHGEISMHKFHALDYLTYAHLQRGDDDSARAALAELDSLEPPFQDHTAVAYALAAIPARYALERHDWQAAAALSVGIVPGFDCAKYPHLVAISQFARGLGAARTGDLEIGREAIEALRGLEERARNLPGAYDWGTQVTIQRLTLEAWMAWANGDHKVALATQKEAAALEAGTEKNPVTPGEVLPAQELYGDMLLEAKQYEAAIDAYKRALRRSSNRFWSLSGVAQAARAAGDDANANEYEAHLTTLVIEGSPRQQWARR